jgi:hypothetical protein
MTLMHRLHHSGFLAIAVAFAGTASFAPATAAPDLTGVWSSYFTTESHPYWQVEDVVCFAGCPVAQRDHIRGLLEDPANRVPINPLALDPAFLPSYAESIMTPEGVRRLHASPEAEAALDTYCEPYGLVREAMNPLTMRIRDEGDRLVIDYEEWSQTRSIHLGAAEPPATPSPLGHSVGRYEGDALVVVTTALTGDYYPGRIGSYSDSATVEERYVVHEEPRRLVLELTVTDPVTLRSPYVWTKTWLYTPDVELLQDSCEDVPGQL